MRPRITRKSMVCSIALLIAAVVFPQFATQISEIAQTVAVSK